MSAYLGDKLVSLTAHIDYNTDDATAGVGDVLQGEVFYNAEGRQVGTHVCPTVEDLLPALSNPAGAEQILSGYQGINGEGASVSGAMTDNGAVSKSINAGASYTIPEGYHNGSGKVTGNSLASQTSATATASDIISGKTAWVDGAKITGAMEKGYKIKTGYVSLSSNTTRGFTIPDPGFTPVGVMYGYMANNGYKIENMYVHWCGISTENKAGLYENGYTNEGSTNITFDDSNNITVNSSSGSGNYFLKGKYYYVVWGE